MLTELLIEQIKDILGGRCSLGEFRLLFNIRYAEHNPHLKVNKFKECTVCTSIFYDDSRNGRRILCTSAECKKVRDREKARRHYNRKNKGIDSAEYQNSGALTSYAPSTQRRLLRQEILFTTVPDEDDPRDAQSLAIIEQLDQFGEMIVSPYRKRRSHGWYPTKKRVEEEAGDVITYYIDVDKL